MPDFPIKLGRSMKEAMPDMPKTDDTHYPSLYLDWDNDYDLPKSGTMTVKFKKVSESNSERSDGKKHQSVTLDILSIDSVKGNKDASDEESPGDHLDKLKQEVESENEDKAENYQEE